MLPCMIITNNVHLMLWLGIALTVLTGLGQLLKTDALDALLSRFNLPPFPKRAIPWTVLVVGVLAAFIGFWRGGATLEEAIGTALLGLFSGAGPTAGHELFFRRYTPEESPASDRRTIPPTKPN
ncbi:MAG: hypothetical protein PVSMB8_00780 [Vulcanimicrobiaceae bacterium]